MSADVVAQVRAIPGVEQADGEAFYGYTVNSPEGPQGVTLLGAEPGKLGAPTVSDGRGLQNRGEVVMPPVFGYRVGDTLTLGGKQFTVVGTLHDSTMLGGIPNLFVGLNDLQDIAYKGAPVISSVAVRGTPDNLPVGLKLLNRSDAHRDLVRPVGSAKSTIFSMSLLLWIVTGCIVGSVIYISALERQRDFAVFKAIGIATRWIMGGLVFQATTIAVVSSAASIGLAHLLAPRMSIPVTIPLFDIVLIPVLAVIVSVLATFVGASRAVRVDPALAFA
jgi:putative ABC transport system permease protein